MTQGYKEPLFLNIKARFMDDGLLGGSGDKGTPKHHDKGKTLKILNGLCFDLFFRSGDIELDSYKNIPDCAVGIPGYTPPSSKETDYRKPLDSPYKKRTYTLSKELPAPPVKKMSVNRDGRKFRSRKRRRR